MSNRTRREGLPTLAPPLLHFPPMIGHDLLTHGRVSLLLEMEDRAILVHTGSVWCLGVHVRDKVLRRDDALGDSILPTDSMAENPQDAAASVRISDEQDRVPVDSIAV